MAIQYLGKTKAPEAKGAYEKALKAHETLGSFTGRFRSLLNLSSLRSIDPQTLSEAFSGKGWAIQRLGEPKAPEAKEAYRKALETYETLGSFTGRFRSLINLSSLSSSTGDYDSASRYLEQALDLARENKRLSQEAEALAEQAKLHGALGVEARSRDAFEKALALLDQVKNLRLKAEILLGRADAHAGMAEYAQAVDLYDRVIELGSIDPQTLSKAFSGKGWALQYLGKTKSLEAKEAYEKAAELLPDNLWVQKGIANALRLCGEDQAAREKYEWVSDEAREEGEAACGSPVPGMVLLQPGPVRRGRSDLPPGHLLEARSRL